MSELCIDASVAIKLALKGEPHRVHAQRLVRDCHTSNVTLIVPPLFEAEVDSAVCKQVYAGAITLGEAKRAYALLDQLKVQITSHLQMRQRARELTERFNQRFVYDCTYAALAELHGCDFWTADKAFYDVVKSALAFVKYLADYP